MPIYRNQETGHEVEVVRGTRLPKVYVEVKRSSKPSTNTKKSNDDPKTTTDKASDDKTKGDKTPKSSKPSTNTKPNDDKTSVDKK